MLDPRTLLLTLIALLLITGVIQLVSARPGRDEASLPYWGAANLAAAAGVLILGLIASEPVPALVNIAFAAILLGYSLNWAGMRHFCGRPASVAVILAPPLVWLVVVQLPLFQSPAMRMAASAALTGGWCLATAWTLYRFRDEDLFARKPAIIWLTLYGALMAVRTPVALSQTFPDGASALASPTMTFALFGAIIHSVLLSFLQIALAKGRADNRYRLVAETDMLTGIANRRAFFEQAEPLVRAAAQGGRPAAMLVIDIDRFKAINDSLGHAAGDAVIIAVAHAIRDSLRPGDMCARLGGEEFGCLLPDTGLETAAGMGEALRVRLSGLGLAFQGTAVRVSASIGIAVTGTGTDTLDRLIAEADAGLYQAKRAGRDRVVAMDVAFVE
ncbi:diguanylate cyclase domain-containing protein [Phreatobacter sp.]|uniref:GGDEF domain-containing protein n=1 Tax=Phreatobacter sp. TaxID=1966341 RepID=UPI003F706FF2